MIILRISSFVRTVNILLAFLATIVLGNEATENAMVDYLTKNNYLHGKSEIVFLLDRSGSIGAANFEAEKGFVESFLTHVVVDANATRVAVISYSDTAERHIDFLKEPKTKCFLSLELQDVIFRDSGATNIAAALEEARLVFLNARPNVNKVLMLISDGFHTKGGDPVPYADELKTSGVQIFCFGIGRFLSSELQSLASSQQHVFSCAGFGEFKRLARKIRGDQHETSWSNQDAVRKCYHLCDSPYKGNPEDPGCCDHDALCSCALLSGTHTCVCRPGYYGLSGLMGRCAACPRGTYKSKLEPARRCTSCPPGATTADITSTSIKDCHCKEGYQGDPSKGIECSLIKCPPLQSPTHGITLLDCSNTYGSMCHFMCDEGYEFVDPTSDVRTCQSNGEWSGKTAVCRELRCLNLPSPSNGNKFCESDLHSVGTKCRFHCDMGHVMQGSGSRECLPNKKWSGVITECIPVQCNIPPPIRNGRHTCPSNKKPSYSSVCAYICNEGFERRGPQFLTCNNFGELRGLFGEKEQPFCEDIQPPELVCPNSIKVKNSKGKGTAKVSWKLPQPTDNSGMQPSLYTHPPNLTPPVWFPIGLHIVSYVAEDRECLKTTCNFTVEVLDEEPPVVMKCPSKVEASTSDTKTAVDWEEPYFIDNDDNELTIFKSARSGEEFEIGSHVVTYTARDSSGNTKSCIFKVDVSRTTCPYYPPPINGAFACNDWMVGQFCQAYCNDRYDFSEKQAEWYVCNGKDQWVTMPENMPVPWPDCSKPIMPSEIRQTLKAYLYSGDCNDPAVQAFIKNKFLAHVVNRLDTKKLCVKKGDCSVKTVSVTCGKEIDFLKKRMRRDIWKHAHKEEMELEFEIIIHADQELNDTEAILQDFLETIRNLDWSIESDSENELTTLSSDMGIQKEINRTTPVVIAEGEVQLVCKVGSILGDNMCVLCPSGTFFDANLKECLDCPLGQYQEYEGEFKCEHCPSGTSTEHRRSKTKSDCKAICLHGTFSPSGLETCLVCPIGTFQEYAGQSSCTPCPNGTTTAMVQSASHTECKEMCLPGTYSSNGLLPCQLCSWGYYQTGIGQSSCLECPTDLVTIDEGATTAEECVDIDPCLNKSLCLNDGQCKRDGRKGICLCKEGFEGEDCGDDINECLEDPCFNGGMCVNTNGSFRCQCLDGFTGELCRKEIDECASSPCQNNGTCLDQVNGYLCLCTTGYEGLNCEVEQELCFHDMMCLNGGNCVTEDSNSSFCLCAEGYEGIDCGIDIDDCENTTCHNNGSCIDGIGSYTCVCSNGYSGTLCEFEINECENNVCKAGSLCKDLVGSYECLCPPGWNGTLCENKLDSDFIFMFPESNVTIANMASVTLNSPLAAATVSMWVQTNDHDRSGTPLSYAVASTSSSDADGNVVDNALTISDCSGLQVYVNNQPVMTNLQVADGMWHHVAFSWSSEDSGMWSLYKDGELQSEGTNLRPGEVISKGGTMIIGQEQDDVGAAFSPFETFSGNISRVNVWNSYFSRSNVTRLCRMDDDIPGKVVAWPDFLHGVQGDIQILKNQKPTDLQL